MQRMAPCREGGLECATRARALITLDFVGTLAAAGLVLFAGYGLQRRVGLLARYNIPAPVVGGLLVALGITALRALGHQPLAFDTTLQAPLMIAFFTSIGFGASVPLLRAGGPAVVVFLALATAVAVLQNLVGAARGRGPRRAARSSGCWRARSP